MKIYEYRILNIIRYFKINEYRIVLFGPNYTNNQIIELFVETLQSLDVLAKKTAKNQKRSG